MAPRSKTTSHKVYQQIRLTFLEKILFEKATFQPSLDGAKAKPCGQLTLVILEVPYII